MENFRKFCRSMENFPDGGYRFCIHYVVENGAKEWHEEHGERTSGNQYGGYVFMHQMLAYGNTGNRYDERKCGGTVQSDGCAVMKGNFLSCALAQR